MHHTKLLDPRTSKNYSFWSSHRNNAEVCAIICDFTAKK